MRYSHNQKISSSCLELRQTTYNTKNYIFRSENSKVEEIKLLYRQVVNLIESNFIDISNKEFSRKIRIGWSSSIKAFKFSGDQIEYKRELWDKAHKKFTTLKHKNEIINKINEDISILNAVTNSDEQNSLQYQQLLKKN